MVFGSVLFNLQFSSPRYHTNKRRYTTTNSNTVNDSKNDSSYKTRDYQEPIGEHKRQKSVLKYNEEAFINFSNEIKQFIKSENIFTSALHTLAYGTDASLYRLIPKMVLHVQNEEEIRRILPIAQKWDIPVTFRAAGTSLSGQAITESVLLKIKPGSFRRFQIHHDNIDIPLSKNSKDSDTVDHHSKMKITNDQ
jgi:hypothetical protein